MIFVLILVFLDLSSAQIIQQGQCDPNIQLATNFNVTEFYGRWYVVSRTSSSLTDGDCSYFEFASQTNSISVYKRGVRNNFLEELSGTAALETGTAKLSLTTASSSQPLDFWILLTDPEYYALAYSCENLGTTQRSITLWQLGRETIFEYNLMIALMNVTLNSLLGITLEDLTKLDHSEMACAELPVIPEGESVVLPGQCDPNVSVVQNFDVERFTGVWHEISSYYSPNALGSCPRAEYTLSGNVVNVLNSQVVDQTLDTISGTAMLANDDGSGRLTVRLEVAPGVLSEASLLILATDYDSYAVSYVCVDLPNNQKQVTSWIVSRTRQLSANASAAVAQVISSQLDLNTEYFIAADQSDEGCFYFPDPVENQSVTFRGQCDESIPAMANFDPERYMGIWHDIESYPSEFQDGTCNNAEYTLVNDEVDVFNTQVIDQRLDTIRGVARLVSSDGSAKLMVSFPIAGTNFTTTTNYWVLRTDYTSYALVYTCENINADERRVWSWKLSRTKQLTPEAVNQINEVISTIPVLDQRYYDYKDQSVEGCFYFPEPQRGVPVVFPGQCDENVSVVENFNLGEFTGIWYEVQAYPKVQQTGECISHAMTSSMNVLNLQSSSVTDQQLQVTTGTISFVSTDLSAKLVININNDIQIPFWILRTDYSNYALAYSCENVNTDFRKIYSWKLSRSQVLSANSITEINNAMANNVVLDNQYFDDVDHSDRACFALPDIPTGEPFIIDGQCDTTIQGIANFDAARYLGRWRLIQSYASEFQTGTCSDATYSLGSDNSVIVVNSEVVNQTLETITGSADISSTDNSGRLLVTFPGAPEPIEYIILDTDYSSYSLVYSCSNINNQQRRIWSWKMSRSRELTPAAIENINRVIDEVDVLNNRFYETIDQTDNGCFYYPVHEHSTPVVFRGKCDPNVAVVTNFNAVDYMGKWYDIASYPSVFQDGTCNTAEYTLVGDTVDVFNTQVINETLDTINGVARLVGADGSAKLVVNFPIQGTNFSTDSDYWVLATDYSSYALVYTCVDLEDDESRMVWSWKLSRTRQLTTYASNEIDQAISAVPVLDNRYYNDRDHSDEGCFYYPEPVTGVPVEFPGLCDSNVQAISNFTMERFAGDWYEIEAYPKEFQPGQCVSHAYTSGTGNTLNLVSTNVNNETLGTSTSVLRFASTQDTSGRLELVTTSNGVETVMPFWIIDTDYNRYALAYSCINDVVNNRRTVYSWKLSRSKELSTIDNTFINNAMNNIQVLDNQYFERIYQTDDACFYLPVHVTGQPVIFPGQCDENIAVVQDFNAAAYLSRWRLIESYPTEFQEGSCIDATYTLNENGLIDVYNTQVINQELDTILGNATFAVNDTTGKLLVYFPGVPVPAEYWVLDTDYNSFALVYSCYNLNNEQRRVTSWKMSRTAQLSSEAEERIERVIESIPVLNSRYFDTVDQTDAGCFYYPEPTDQPVVFRGQCDQNVNVVQNFDAQRYMGLWYDISSYPSMFQSGTCNTAEYTLVGDTVDVFNTQVINETLDTINGVARLANNSDGSAKLVVTFPIVGTNFTTDADYWVLATDYTSYALVYTCIDFPEDESRLVWSWKLSRTKQLTTEANNEINQAINAVQVLDNRYYIGNDHSDEGCFYYPEPEDGVPVEFPGLCDSTVQAIPNFNMDSFTGSWYEIEAYPKEFQPGQCVSHAYTSGTGNTLNLVSSNVNNETLGTSSSVLRFASAQDSSGRLELVTTSNGVETVMPFWIIDTDYSRYALAYSCVNDVTRNRRTVYSWKLSRSKELSSVDNTFINNAISNVQVLDNRYFERINQSDSACFYLPEYVPGQTVTFPGQCDQNIPVVQNFNPAAYQGRWRMIESYPSDFQGGDCSDATYTINAESTVDVYNTQVINQTLDTINGNAELATADGSGKLLVTFPGAPFPSEYWILDTDYDNFALVYSCLNINSEERRVWSWKLSRTTSLSAEAIAAINEAVDSINVLNARYYERIDHSDDACFYYPIPDGNPVVFRGQCDESIAVVQNFDAEAYMGKWYDLQSYPVAFQEGTCPTATYSLTGDGVSVYNTQVVAQELDSINGVAEIASDDGSAKLLVTFPIPGTDILSPPSPYWVLDTDYNNFALVYSCVNIDDETRRVSSWKLSRQWNLTQTSENAINAAIARVPVLSQDYYLTRGHDEESCFYYPDNEGGPVVLSGRCNIDDINIVSNFNVNAFSGSWYEVERYPSELQSGECVANTYDVAGTNTFDLTMTIVDNERTTVVTGPATVSSDNQGILDVNLSNGAGVNFATTMYVVDVEYDDFALLYACSDVANDSRQLYSWKLSRSQQGLSANANTRIDAIVNNTVDLFNGYYEETDQTVNGCFYYPEYDGEVPIDLLGPCDETIRAKPNFDVARYLGEWYEIASYPQAFQDGECARALYTLGNNVVDVLNTQVINRTLDTMTGTATVASADDSGLLSVTFELANGVINVANYYVLETDYDTFALVYSCRNLDSGNRQVTSWKLSRGPTLSNAAEEIMRPIIESTQGLLEEYYQPTNQTEDACFYIPEVNADKAALFRGQCEEITGMNGFNPQRYVGWWHEIERYPVDGNAGDCISSDFRVAGNQYQVIDTSVFDLVAESNTSTVTVTNDGRITKTYSNGRVEYIWVLATDYETYSLLYSCENIPDSQYMRVWSAKHSKTRSLTQAAQDAMAPLIAANRVLEPQFYLEVDQSDDACFHYPEQSGDQVILPGQCDEDIPVEQQFDPARYTGRWYQIERYPQVHESGSCIGAEYKLDESTGVVTVLNWQVIEDALDTVTGTATVNSTDGSAKLIVNLPIRGDDEEENPTMVSMWLYVLETNYLSYSVTYSCVNVGDFHRSVGVWKLSRTRNMLEADDSTINSLISRRPELHQPYFLKVEQNEDCDEPNSAVTVYNSVIVLLLCVIVHALR